MVDGGRSIGLRSWAVTLQPWAGNEMNQYTEIGSGEDKPEVERVNSHSHKNSLTTWLPMPPAAPVMKTWRPSRARNDGMPDIMSAAKGTS